MAELKGAAEDEKRIWQAHDKLFKRTFRNPALAEIELRAILPPALVRHIDFSVLEAQPVSVIDERLVESRSDLLLKTLVAEDEALLYILFEHQSTVDPLMQLRLGAYVMRVLEELVKKEQLTAPPLPLVVPVVLHHSDTGWKLARDFHSLFAPRQLGLEGVSELVPQFTFVLDDISHVSDEELRGRTAAAVHQLSAMLPLTLMALRDSRRHEEFRAVGLAWRELIAELVKTADGRAAFRAVLRYCIQVFNLTREDIITVSAAAAPEAKKVAMTLAEQLRTEGRVEGRVEGAAFVLQNQLKLKFGEPAAEVTARLEAASESDILRWSERILSAASIDEIFD